MNYTFRTRDHPEADGRKPKVGEFAWNITFHLEDKGCLTIHCGKEAFEAFIEMIKEMENE